MADFEKELVMCIDDLAETAKKGGENVTHVLASYTINRYGEEIISYNVTDSEGNSIYRNNIIRRAKEA